MINFIDNLNSIEIESLWMMFDQFNSAPTVVNANNLGIPHNTFIFIYNDYRILSSNVMLNYRYII